MSSRSSRAWVARTVLPALLFAQVALAGISSGSPERSAARAVAAPQSMPCHQAEPSERNANLCLADCLSFDQRPDTPQLPALAPDPAPPLRVPVLAMTVSRAMLQEARVAAASDPPPRILFQVLRI